MFVDTDHNHSCKIIMLSDLPSLPADQAVLSGISFSSMPPGYFVTFSLLVTMISDVVRKENDLQI